VTGHRCWWLAMPRSLARVSTPGVPESLATDRCSQSTLGCAVPAAFSRPCRTEHLSGLRSVKACLRAISCKHL